MNQDGGGSLKHRSKAHLAGFAVDNLLRTFTREGMTSDGPQPQDQRKYDQLEKLKLSSDNRLHSMKHRRF